jgi:cobalamin biosynthesis Mg chelatase CobN
MRHTRIAASLLVVLAAALAPTIAQAETSSEVTYFGGRKSAENNPLEKTLNQQQKSTAHPKPKSDNETQATSPDGGTEPTAPRPEEKTTGKSKEHHPGAGAAHPGTGGGKPSGGAPTKQPSPTPTKSSSAPEPGTNQISADGGSSPIVPILIAIGILAAASIGFVLYRERRQRGDTLTGAS